MIEEWKPVVGYEGVYEVSNTGKVKVLERRTPYKSGPTVAIRPEKILSLSTDKDGYKIVTLTKQGNSTTKKVHRLVAEAFIDNPLLLPQVNHINGIKSDNSAGNLEWCSARDNIRHKFSVLGYSQRNVRAGKKVITGDGHKYVSIKSAARAFGVSTGTIINWSRKPDKRISIKY